MLCIPHAACTGLWCRRPEAVIKWLHHQHHYIQCYAYQWSFSKIYSSLWVGQEQSLIFIGAQWQVRDQSLILFGIHKREMRQLGTANLIAKTQPRMLLINLICHCLCAQLCAANQSSSKACCRAITFCLFSCKVAQLYMCMPSLLYFSKQIHCPCTDQILIYCPCTDQISIYCLCTD